MDSKLDAGEKILARSGLSKELLSMEGEIDQVFLEILRALQKIHKGKGILYGNYMETHGGESEKLSLIQHFCDIKRKWVRIESFIVGSIIEGNADIPLEELLDTYSDMAVYSALGIQLLSHLIDERAGSSGVEFNNAIIATPDEHLDNIGRKHGL